MTSAVYLDHAGAGRFVPEQIEAVTKQLTGSIFSNPHSRSASSKLTTDLIDQARYRILEHFKTTTDEYSVIFTSGCTAALKLIAESLDWDFRCDYCHPRNDRSLISNRENRLSPSDDKDHVSIDHQLELSVSDHQNRLLSIDHRLDSEIEWSKSIGPKFIYLMDNHTSVVGMREYPFRARASVQCLNPDDVDKFIEIQKSIIDQSDQINQCACMRLFVYPGQSNFCGRKYTKEFWTQKFHQLKQRWLVCLDAASLVSTSDYDLNREKPDFVTMSFYKIFGYPTGLGALLVRNETIGKTGNDNSCLMQKSYFGGGTVQVALNRRKFVKFRNDSLSQKFEDGTLAFQQILALKHGFDALQSRGGMQAISSRTFSLASYAYRALTKIKHQNGSTIALVYCHNNYEDSDDQGPIVNFNLLRPDGSYVGYAEAEKLAELYDIHWRTGCFCNQGACQLYLQLTDESLMKNFESGKVCGDTIDLIDNKPVGSIRISLGWTSTLQDVQQFVRMIWECFVDRGSLRRTVDEALIDFEVNPPSDLSAIENNRLVIDNRENRYSNHNGLINEESQEEEEYFEAIDSDRADQSIPAGHNQKVQLSSDHKQKKQLSIGHNQSILSISPSNTNQLSLTDIYIFPIKSCSATSVQKWAISEKGFLYDRRWMIVTSEGLCLNQKRESKMCLIKPELNTDAGRLTLNCDYVDRALSVPLNASADFGDKNISDTAIAGPYCHSKVCADRVSTSDCGDVVGEWIDDALNRNGCRLVVQTDDIPRKGKGQQDVSVSLANEEQYLLLHHSSIRRLYNLIHTTSPHITEDDLILRFRPNLVVDGGQPFEEDTWKSLTIGGVRFQCVGKCTRCQMICVDQNTGEMDKNVLLALRELRDSKITFGVYLQTSNDQAGRWIQVGQSVTTDTSDIQSSL